MYSLLCYSFILIPCKVSKSTYKLFHTRTMLCFISTHNPTLLKHEIINNATLNNFSPQIGKMHYVPCIIKCYLILYLDTDYTLPHWITTTKKKQTIYLICIVIDLLVEFNVYTAEKRTMMNNILYYYFLLI